MKCLSIRQPWAWLIVNGHKDIENRTRKTNFRGTILIHAALQPYSKGYLYDRLEADIFAKHHVLLPPNSQAYQRTGGIVGIAEIVDCVTTSSSPWFDGPFGYVIANAEPLSFVGCKGRLGLFEAPPEVIQRLGLSRP